MVSELWYGRQCRKSMRDCRGMGMGMGRNVGGILTYRIVYRVKTWYRTLILLYLRCL